MDYRGWLCTHEGPLDPQNLIAQICWGPRSEIFLHRSKSFEIRFWHILSIQNIMYLNTAAFNIEYKYPISVYGDCVSLSFQNYVIIFLMWKYNDQVSTMEKWIAGGTYALIVFVLLTMPLSNRIWAMILDLSTFLSKYRFCLKPFIWFFLDICSKVPQIHMSWKNKSCGKMSLATYSLNWAGSLARSFTVFVEAKDDVAYVFQ